MKKILSFVLACMLCFSLASPAYAATYTEAVEIETAETPTPRGFVRQYRNYYVLDGGYQLVVEDPNYDFFVDTYVVVSLIRGDGPTALDVKVSYKRDSATSWTECGSGTINAEGTACSFTIPENYTFKVEAKATAGKSGYATIQVVLE